MKLTRSRSTISGSLPSASSNRRSRSPPTVEMSISPVTAAITQPRSLRTAISSATSIPTSCHGNSRTRGHTYPARRVAHHQAGLFRLAPAGSLALVAPHELVKPVEQPVGVVVVVVGRQADPQAAVVAQAQPARRLEGIEGTGRRVHAQRGQVPVRVPGVAAAEGQQQGGGAPRGPGPDGDAGQGPDVLLDPVPEPVFVFLDGGHRTGQVLPPVAGG